MTYEVIESNPPAQVLAAVHSLRLKKVTSDNSTFVEWSSDFSAGDSTAAAVEDARFKRKEAFAVKFLKSGGTRRRGGKRRLTAAAVQHSTRNTYTHTLPLPSIMYCFIEFQ